MTPIRTTVHVMRHGEVYNPEKVLYGRLPGYRLSDEGLAMAKRAADWFTEKDVVHLVASPLERTQQTAGPLAEAKHLEIHVDERIIEAGNAFEGLALGDNAGLLRAPRHWWKLRNPLRPSWGEPYDEIAGRMVAAIHDARDAARGHEAVVVSHQLPIWTTRLFLEKRSYLHHPKNRQCTLCSLTSVVFDDDRMVQVRYSEPAGDLIPAGDRSAPF